MFRFRDRSSKHCLSKVAKGRYTASLPGSWKPVPRPGGARSRPLRSARRPVSSSTRPVGRPSRRRFRPRRRWRICGSARRAVAARGRRRRAPRSPRRTVTPWPPPIRPRIAGDVVNIDSALSDAELVDDSSHDSCSSPVVFQGVSQASVVLAGSIAVATNKPRRIGLCRTRRSRLGLHCMPRATTSPSTTCKQETSTWAGLGM